MKLINKLVRKNCITLIQYYYHMATSKLHQPIPPSLWNPTHVPCGITEFLNILTKLCVMCTTMEVLIPSRIRFGKLGLEVWCDMNGLSRSQTDCNADKAINIQVALTSVLKQVFVHNFSLLKWIFLAWPLSCKSRLCARTSSETEVKSNLEMAYCVVPENIHTTPMVYIFGLALSATPTSIPLRSVLLFFFS